MQTLATILIVLGAVAYVAWQWMPKPLLSKTGSRTTGSPSLSTSGTARTCSACGSCGACPKG
ncbi:MAG TPA: hypothetical protein PJ983_08140 [Flavobacteriales bacterium]|nr:hypothetical protein [Flavobacteriales bacterium]HMZ48704.1 hypothetical protein [Flavobacteriales bacterium]